jgi:hypothetical protein
MGLVRAFRRSYDLEAAKKTCRGFPFLLNMYIKTITATAEHMI